MIFNDVMLGVLIVMPLVFIVAIRKVTAQRQKQNELLERIATALEARDRA